MGRVSTAFWVAALQLSTVLGLRFAAGSAARRSPTLGRSPADGPTRSIIRSPRRSSATARDFSPKHPSSDIQPEGNSTAACSSTWAIPGKFGGRLPLLSACVTTVIQAAPTATWRRFRVPRLIQLTSARPRRAPETCWTTLAISRV